MTRTVRITDACWDELDDRWEWYRDHISHTHASRWYDAALTAADGLAEGAEARPLCLDPALDGSKLREAYFGAGRGNTHRLIYRIAGTAVDIVTVRGFEEDELIPADLG